ncbi:4-hydroxy-tetrahydrodipicolinate synthase [Rhizobium sp. S152]|uniref:4-hydroxy-tetrahydrodipicolinate synthase n=1 Tax=Rhizobium sp. S152 TaxID=3055038 RepID=UPI0025AA1E1E|nr:4-hydroxy-tetrahydrodipicolinate synthase [Rhizobium sp. S152]MDM9629373.1 4-hydroxy-tetrahydrodipicolinate synthase [Rhizobium sp. S152]
MPGDKALRLGATTTALITPFRDDKVDIGALERLVERQVLAGVDGLAVCTPTAESPTLTIAERSEIIRTCVRIAAGRVPVVAATGTNDTAGSIELTRRAEALGAGAALVTVPYYSKPGQNGMINHFRQIATASRLPLIVYDDPSRTATRLTEQTMAALADIPLIVGLASCCDGCEMPAHLRGRFHHISGDDASAVPFLVSGGHGILSTGANVQPRLFGSMHQAARGGNLAAARVLHDRLLPLMRSLGADGDPSIVKYALHLTLGIDPAVRLPLLQADREVEIAIADALADLSCGGIPGISI